ncbi:MaoC family dehydratase [Clostridium sp. CF011]|uniref:MaoC family dehydratase n=1 Tax=Clostridium TaxID=1485 RepID=UPI0013EEC46C|nr:MULTISPECIES: MaoC family dehydratase [Clostridium]MBU3092961.1 MaoC family dehydratase [Clostridium sp. CF011]MBZ9608169.1 MaoC family dehydratase [Clostridium estertheticum]WAG70366.1 MaoC family dehydratase [Clostridium sp. CF011]
MADFKSFYVGQSEEYIKRFTEAEVESYARITGDYNYVHMDEEKAKKSFFKGRIVHGQLVGGMISALLGTKLPGGGNIYLRQSFEFLKPVRIGDTIKAKAIITEINEKKKILLLDTFCLNEQDEIVIKGKAEVLVLR